MLVHVKELQPILQFESLWSFLFQSVNKIVSDERSVEPINLTANGGGANLLLLI